MTTLSGPELPPQSGARPDSLVILLHGIGSDGRDLINLADFFAHALPNAVFHAPNAPQPFAEAGFGYQWYPRARLAEGGNQGRLEQEVNAFIDELLDRYELESSRCLLVGFSQGSTVALHVAPRRAETLAGVVAFSGAMPTASTFGEQKRSAPPVLLIHGREDPVLSSQETEKAARVLEEAGVPVSMHLLAGLGHSIDKRGIDLAIQFMKQVLKLE